jgi:hypothetical protein
MSDSLIIYIDESGDEGFQFGFGSSRWFVLAATLYELTCDKELTDLVERVKTVIYADTDIQRRLSLIKRPLHFRDLRHEQRKYWVSEIAKSRCRVLTICIDKKSFDPNAAPRNGAWLYLHAVNKLLDSLLDGLCIENNQNNEQVKLRLVFSNRSTMNYDTIRSEVVSHPLSVTTEVHVETYSAGKRKGLQVADAVASSTYFALEDNRFGQTETGYLNELANVLLPEVYEPSQPWLIVCPRRQNKKENHSGSP